MRSLNAPFGAQCFPTRRACLYRPESLRLNAPFGAQCFPTQAIRLVKVAVRSQCTFWCSVLSDENKNVRMGSLLRLNAPFGAQCFPTGAINNVPIEILSLNAPFGAQCFPTHYSRRAASHDGSVSMHLLVLSAFRQGVDECR